MAWFKESKRHRLSALGIRTGRKMLPKKPLTVLSGSKKLFYPQKDTEKMTVEQPITIVKSVGEIATSGMKKGKKKKLNFTNLNIIAEN